MTAAIRLLYIFHFCMNFFFALLSAEGGVKKLIEFFFYLGVLGAGCVYIIHMSLLVIINGVLLAC